MPTRLQVLVSLVMTFRWWKTTISAPWGFLFKCANRNGGFQQRGNACSHSKQRQKGAVCPQWCDGACQGAAGGHYCFLHACSCDKRQHAPIRRAADKQATAGWALTLGLFPSLRPTFSSRHLATHFLLPRLRRLPGNPHNTTARLSTQWAPVVSIKEWECVRIYTLNLCGEKRCRE